MELDLDPSSPVPLYLQLVEQVRRLVALGALRPGDQLPTVRELAVRTRGLVKRFGRFTTRGLSASW